MSDEPFTLAPTRLMTAERARDVARSYKALATHLTELGVIREATLALRDSQWWLTYALVLSQTAGSGPQKGEGQQ